MLVYLLIADEFVIGDISRLTRPILTRIFQKEIFTFLLRKCSTRVFFTIQVEIRFEKNAIYSILNFKRATKKLVLKCQNLVGSKLLN